MKNRVNPLRVSRFLRVYDDAAAQKGIRLSVGFDFHKYAAIVRGTPTKEFTSPLFQLDLSPVKSGDGFWMIGVDKNDDVVILQAVRLFHLSRSSLAEHLCADPALNADAQQIWICTAPSAKKITGKVAYHGDAWVRKDYRGQGMPSIMAGVAFGVSFAMWSPDFVCGLVARSLGDKGLIARYGYPHYESGGLQVVEQNDLDDYLLVWLTGEELWGRIDSPDTRCNP